VFVKPSCGEEAVEKSFPDESSHACEANEKMVLESVLFIR
jgi:hypothetical protein